MSGRDASAADASSRASAPREPWLALVVRMLVHGVAAAVFVWPLAPVGAVVVAAGGGLAGAGIGGALARTRARLPVLVVGALAGLALAGLARSWVVDGALAASLGPAGALELGDALLFGLGALSVSTGLRAASARYRPLGVLEAVAVALSFAQLVIAHRGGAINRPFDVADPILESGGDPTLAFLLVGAGATAVIVVLLLDEPSVARTVLHLAVVGAVLFTILGTTRMLGLPPPPPGAGGLGLRPEDEGRSGEGGGRRDNDELEFRDNYDSEANRVPLGVVLFHDDYSPPSGVYYFRQGAFSQFNGRRLVQATRRDVDRDLAAGFSAETLSDVPEAEGARERVRTTVALLATHTRAFGLEAPVRVEPADNPDTVRFERVYQVTSRSLSIGLGPLLGARAGRADWGPEQWAHYTALPDDPRYAALAAEVIATELPEGLRDDAIARAVAITHWLGQHGVYSLRSRHAGADDPTASFLFGDRTGYCVHFAHAATYLLRSAGVPARVATGYAVDESARQGGSALLLAGANSHAWPEVYVDGVGWVVFDVVPATVLDAPPPPPDPELQRLLGELARGLRPLPDEGVGGLPALDDARDWFRSLMRWLGAWALRLLLLGVLPFFALVKLWRRLVPRFAGARALPRVVYRAELDRLGELSFRRRRGESREAFAARVRAVSPAFAELTREHVGAAMGSRRHGRDPARCRALAARSRAEIALVVPRWRRWTGALNPFSWVTTR